MNIQEFAKLLDGREYDNEITPAEEKQAKELGFVVVFGVSDDLIELRGAIDDEAGCFDGGEIYLAEDGLLEECGDNCKYFRAARKQCKTIEVVWYGEDDYLWTYKTDIPHATFDIMDDGEPYCRGIVFELKSLEARM